MPLKGKQIVITGGSGGIGIPLCKRLIAEGAGLTLIGKETPVPFEAEWLQGDLASETDMRQIIGMLKERQVDLLINLAGVQFFGPLEQQTPAQLVLTLHVNLLAPLLLTQAILAQMKARNAGQIVNIGSTFGSIPFAHFASYSSSKAGLRGFSEALRRELSDTGIGVTHISPRAVKTALNKGKVDEFAELTRMAMDEPDAVAALIVKAIQARQPELFIGFPEKLFVKLNALMPRLIDGALKKNDRLAASLFH